jgi:hypothetical protein
MAIQESSDRTTPGVLVQEMTAAVVTAETVGEMLARKKREVAALEVLAKEDAARRKDTEQARRVAEDNVLANNDRVIAALLKVCYDYKKLGRGARLNDQVRCKIDQLTADWSQEVPRG